MCAHPGCGLPDFKLRGPIAQPPEGGWRIQTVPEEAAALQPVWDRFQTEEPQSGQAAQWLLVEFLQNNGFKGPNITREVFEIGARQWCRSSPDRCPKEFRKFLAGTGKIPEVKPAVDLRWATIVWRLTNYALHDAVKDEDAQKVLQTQVDFLTAAINSPDGCPKCAGHWTEILTETPPTVTSLKEARQWLWAAHNKTREEKPPTPFSVVQKLFGWSS